MTKAQRIRELYAQGKTCGEIAALIGCRVEYARVCAQQRAKGESRADKNWKVNAADHIRRQRREKWRWRYATDPVFRERHKATKARYYHQAKLREATAP